jgi:hypothetical protein
MSFLYPFRDHRRRELAARPFPVEWDRVIDRNVPYGRHLLPEERRHWGDLIKVFIAEKHFEGCGELEITDEIKVTIAAQACILLLNLHHNYYDRLVSIVVYPDSFVFEQDEADLAGTVSSTRNAALGLSSTMGVVVLSWVDTVEGARNPLDGGNVVFHEFAHQLDQLDGSMDGAPPLDSGSAYQEWARVLCAEFRRLHEAIESDVPSLIRDYGATKPAEFFAVVTELFFERPVELRRDHPKLYEEFKLYFGQDPAERQPIQEAG